MKIINLFLFLYLCCSSALAADNAIILENISADEGLQMAQIHKIYQDYQGVIWFGGFGLCNYDGYTFTNYHYLPHDTHSVYGNVVNDIIEDKQQRLWIATNMGLCYYNRNYENFVTIKFNPISNNNLNDLHISSIYPDTNGTMWLGTELGLFVVSRNTKQASLVNLRNKTNVITINAYVDKVYGNNGYVYSFTRNGVFYKTSVTTFETKVIQAPWESDIKITSVFENQGTIYVLLLNGALYAYYPQSSAIDRLNIKFQGIVPEKQEFTDAQIIDNNIWISSNIGLFIYSTQSKSLTHYYTGNDNIQGITTSNFFEIMVDNNNSVWLGSIDKGVFVWHREKYKFHVLSHYPNTRSNITNNVVLSITEDDNNNIWMATPTYGLIKYNPTNKTSVVINAPGNVLNKKASNNSEISVAVSSNLVYTGHWAKGVTIYNTQNKTFRYLRHQAGEKNSLPSDNVWHIQLDKTGKLWIATLGGGVSCYNPYNNSFINFSTQDNAHVKIPDDYVFCTYNDAKNNTWMGTAGNGLIQYNPETNKITNYKHEKDNPASISNKLVWTILQDSQQQLWVGTSIGLNLFNPEKGTFKSYYTSNGLPDNDIRKILEDQQGNLWISTANGLSKFTPKTGIFKNFTVYDGLPSGEFIASSGMRSKNGNIYLGNRNGLVYFNPANLISNNNPPTVVFTKLLIYNQPVTIGDSINGRVILKKSIRETDTLILTHKEHFFSIGFTAVHHLAPQQNRYAYKLVGFHNQWVETSYKNRSATLNNLQPGHYKLLVKACNNDGVWSPAPACLHIEILPPWWKTWVFRIALVFVITLFTFSALYARFKNLKQRQQFLEQEINNHTYHLKVQAEKLHKTNALLKERQSLIEEQSEELILQKETLALKNEDLKKSNAELKKLNNTKNTLFSIIAHDLKNPFTSLLGLLDLLEFNFDKYDNEKKKRFVKTTKQSAKSIYQLLENLLQWARSQTKTINYNPTDFNYADMVTENFGLFSGQAMKKGIELINNVPPTLNIKADYEMLNTITRNLIGNAIKFTEDGNITVTANKSPKAHRITITDTGIGIPSQKISQLFEIDKNKITRGTKGEGGTGLGLIICKEFIELHNGEIQVESTIKQGSSFSFTVPFD